MSDVGPKTPIPGRAIASVAFACCSLWIFAMYGRVHWLPKRFSQEDRELYRRVVSELGPIRDQMDIGYRVLAALALIWCVWSWQTEGRIAAWAATLFTALAVFCAVFIVI
jgi:hypothetical protein